MVDIKKLAMQAVSKTLGIDITETEFDYLNENWHAWLFNMGKYHALNEMVKDDILELR